MRTLALGHRNSPFYRSIRAALPAFGEVEFVHERRFWRSSGLVDWVRRRKIDRVLMPNPYGNRRRLACYRTLRDSGIEVVASDRGALPDSWFFDRGFNADSSSYEEDHWKTPLSRERKEAVQAYIRDLRATDAALEAQGARAGAAGLRETLSLGDAKILFVPLQRPGDTVVRYMAGAAGSMDGFLRLVDGVARSLARLDGESWRVVVKKHPLEVDRLDLRAEGIVYAADDAHVHDLLELADATLVLNSGVGLLSLLFGKPTAHAGRAMYGQPGLSHAVDGVDDVLRWLNEESAPDTDRVERFADHLLRRVYSFGTMHTELVRDRRNDAKRRVTASIEFRNLRILGEEVAVPRPRALVVAPLIPYPIQRGSEARVDAMNGALIDQGFELHLCLLDPDHGPEELPTVRGHLEARYPEASSIDLWSHPSKSRGIRRLLHWLIRGLGIALGSRQRVANLDTAPWGFRRRVAERMAEVQPAFVLIHYAKLTPCLPRRCGAISVLDTHDDQTALLREGQRHSRNRLDISPWLFERSERNALRRFDRILAIQPGEALTFRRRAPKCEVFVVPAFSESGEAGAAPDDEEVDALFVGSGSTFNAGGLRWFIEEVLPLIVAERPHFLLDVVGSIGESTLLRAVSTQNLRVSGVVDDLAAVYDRARMVIAPIRAGAGMKIKVVEAMGRGQAIVSTANAATGIEVEHGVSAWIADSPEEFAEGILRLLRDPEFRARLRAGVREAHRRGHSREAVASSLACAMRPAGAPNADEATSSALALPTSR